MNVVWLDFGITAKYDIFSPKKFRNFFFTLSRGAISVSVKETHRRMNNNYVLLLQCRSFDPMIFNTFLY